MSHYLRSCELEVTTIIETFDAAGASDVRHRSSNTTRPLAKKRAPVLHGTQSRETICHIKRLPVELLQEIQVWWLVAAEESEYDTTADLVPFYATQVCHSWRHCAISARELWDRVTIRLDARRDCNRPGVWEARIDAHLDRARSGCFTLRLSGHEYGACKWMLPHLLRLLAEARAVHIVASFKAIWIDDLLYRLLKGPTPSITEVAILPPRSSLRASRYNLELIPPTVRSLVVHGWVFVWNHYPTFRDLERLAIITPYSDMSYLLLAMFASGAPNLVDLTLDVRAIQDTGRPITKFASVRKLAIASTNVESTVTEWLKFPAVRSLIVLSNGWNVDGNPFDLDNLLGAVLDRTSGTTTTSFLRDLTVNDAHLTRRDAFALRSAPSLETLELRSCEDDEAESFIEVLGAPDYATANASEGSRWIVHDLRCLKVSQIEVPERLSDSHYFEEEMEWIGSGTIAGRALEMVKARSKASRHARTNGPKTLENVEICWKRPVASTATITGRIRAAMAA